MFCSQCGSEVTPGTKFCPTCGTALPEMPAKPSVPVADPAVMEAAPAVPAAEAAPVAPAAYAPVPAEPPKKRKKKWLIATVAAIGAVAVLGTGVFAAYSLLLTPKARVARAISKSANAYASVSEEYGMPDLAALSEKRPMRETVSVVPDLSAAGLPQSGLGVRLTAESDRKNRLEWANMTAFHDDTDLFGVQVSVNDAVIALGSAELTNGRFYGVNTETLGKDLQRFDVGLEETFGFNLFDLYDNLTKAGKPDSEAVKALLSAITVEKTGDSDRTVNGHTVSCTGYRVVIPEDALNRFIKDVTAPWTSGDFMKAFTDLPELKDIWDEVQENSEDTIDKITETLGDVTLDVYLSGGYVMAVTTELDVSEDGQNTLAVEWALGGGKQYVNDMTLTLTAREDGEDRGVIALTCRNDYTGKKAAMTSSFSLTMAQNGETQSLLSGEGAYDPQASGENFSLTMTLGEEQEYLDFDYDTMQIVTRRQVPMTFAINGRVTADKDALTLDLSDVRITVAGTEIGAAVKVEIAPCDAVTQPTEPATMLPSMNEAELERLAEDVSENFYETLRQAAEKSPALADLFR